MRVDREFSPLSRLWRYLFQEVDGASLAVFRICFGGLLLFESVNYGIFLCLDCMYRSSTMLFKYHYFEWVTLLPGIGLELVFAVMGFSAIGVMLGWYYRVCIVVLMLCFSYLFFLDQALYLNHFYMVLLLIGIMIFLPANRCWAMDANNNKNVHANSHGLVPNWSLLWMAVQLEIILLYAGLVKLNYDWLNLEPMRLWMQASAADESAIFQWLSQDPGIALASYGVIALHIIGAPLLLIKKTRLPVFIIYCVFHITNTFVFDIGIFPWMTIAATLLLFDPDWPRQVLSWFNERGRFLKWQYLTQPVTQFTSSVHQTPRKGVLSYALITFIGIWLVLQAVVPLRHYSYPGDVAWNEAGHQFSWRMKLRDKRGLVIFHVVAADGRTWRVKPDKYLNYTQRYRMACIPELVWQFAQMLDSQYKNSTGSDVQVYALTQCSLNTRKPVPLIKREVDLSAIPRDHPIERWVHPLSEELPKPWFKW